MNDGMNMDRGMSGPMWIPVEPPTLEGLLAWHPQPYAIFPILCALLVGLYAVGLVRLWRRDIHWPIGRTVSWLVGVAMVLWVTATGIEGYGMAMFSVHMFQHMILTMLAPVFLLMGAPVTLMLRALPAGRGRRAAPRRALVWLLHSPIAKVGAHPAFTLSLFVFSLYGVYFTPIFDTLMSSVWGHYLMLLHFVITGVVFFGPVLMVDPWPGTKNHLIRMMLMMAGLPFHAFFAIAVMMSPGPIVRFFASPPPSWNVDIIDDQLWAGGLTWVFGDIPTIVVMIVLAVLWMRSDDRLARRTDRKAERDGDAELNSYNAYLQRLADHEAAVLETGGRPTPFAVKR
ncbi:cytochrome c oxidase assembly protein [Nocardiopsis tropica]|uniref:Cytochrome c oxidase assembly protein n=1 Tax=Nocardiopsis tropica TaxID=109330 RepID=A0ABU7KK05_9ACTN|nr:cytochrome c oxidase assembly protein [Nocardiopsis umidischolae]MEE2049625.1 cytochrome c oxidase assembly protein [Nocardiopsis umidischolae]